MAYNKACLIGYQCTTSKFAKDLSGTCDPAKDNHLIAGMSAVVNIDAIKQLQNVVLRYQATLFAKALYKAYQQINLDTNAALNQPQVLKVFVSPEFFFRPSAKNEQGEYAYTQEERDALFDALNSLPDREKFKDWVIVAGTVIWGWKNAADANKYYVMNSAFFKYGAQQNFKKTTKHEASDDDKIQNNDYKPQNIAAQYHGNIFEAWADNHIQVDQKKLGVEICRDHVNKNMILKKALMNRRKVNEGKNDELTFHILTCCNVLEYTSSIACKKHGIFFRLDGLKPSDDRVTIKQCTQQGYAKDFNYYHQFQAYMKEYDNVDLAKAWYNSLKNDTERGKWGNSPLGAWHKYLRTQDDKPFELIASQGESAAFVSWLNTKQDRTLLGNAEVFTAVELPDDLQRTAAATKDRLIISDAIPISQASDKNQG